MSNSAFCRECGLVKQTRHCDFCGTETPTLYKTELFEIINLKDQSKSRMKSGARVNGKPKNEIIQYVGNKDEKIISEIEKLREHGKPTKVIHRLWKRFDDLLRRVHEHEK